MGIEDFADIVENVSAGDIDSFVEINPDAFEYGSEFLSDSPNIGDSFGQWDQVGDFAGDSNFVDATNPGSIVDGASPTDFGSTTIGFDDGSTLTTAADGTVSATAAPSFTLETLQAKAGFALDDLSKSLSKTFSPANISKTVEGYAKSLIQQTVKQAVAAVVPPALQPYANQAINTATRSLSGAGAVSSSIRGTPGFVGPPAPLPTAAFPTPTNAGP